jgi:hypothetical protein
MIDKTSEVLQKVKCLGFTSLHQLYLAENKTGFYWVSNGAMGTQTYKPVEPIEMDAILNLLAKNILVRISSSTVINNKHAYYVILKIDLTEEIDLLPADKIPDETQSFMQKYNLRKNSTRRRLLGLVEVANDPSISTKYAWNYYAGMGDSMLTEVDKSDIKIIDEMLKHGLLTKGTPYKYYKFTYTDIKLTP